jgi:glycosyltransferase involved in cell wall biosynthesis
MFEVTGDASKVRVVPNVVDERVFRGAAEGSRVADQILFVGIVRRSKGVDILLEAMHLLRRDRPRARLLLVGDPFYRAYQAEQERLLALAASLGVGDLVQVVGGQTPATVARLMSESSVVVLPSRRESFGTVLIEAMACGTPVVSTRCGGPEETVNPTVGRLVPTEDPRALASALDEVLSGPDLFPPQALRRYALRHFGTDIVSKQLAGIFASVMDDWRASARSAQVTPVRSR